MSKESLDQIIDCLFEAAYKQGYQAAERHYQTMIAAMQGEIDHLNRSKGAAKSTIKALRAQVGG